MNYGLKRRINMEFEKVDKNIREALMEEGFGIITEIDVQKTFKQKLNRDFKKYKILGVCVPNTAFQAISVDEQIGLLLPCKMAFWENEDKSTTVAAIDFAAQLSSAGVEELKPQANQINSKLKNAMNKL